MTLEGTLFAATLVAILINIAGWEGLCSYYLRAVAPERATFPRLLRFVRPLNLLSGYLTWMIWLEFAYYVALLLVLVKRPDLLPAWAVIPLFLYHAFGFLGNQMFRPLDRIRSPDPRRAIKVLALIGALEVVEILLLGFFAIRLRARG